MFTLLEDIDLLSTHFDVLYPGIHREYTYTTTYNKTHLIIYTFIHNLQEKKQ